MTVQSGLAMAKEQALDLVEISPHVTPPVCKIIDIGKFKYEQQKRLAGARKNQKVVAVKEIKLRPGTDVHDYGVKIRSIERFLGDGDKVKVVLRFRGREIVHQEIGQELLERVIEDTNDIGKIETKPQMEGRQMVMIIAPK